MPAETWLASPFTWLLMAGVMFALLGLVAMFALGRALHERRPVRAMNRLVAMLAFDAVALASLMLAMALHGYGRLTTETPVARLSFSQTGPQQFQAAMRLPDGTELTLPLIGDEWQLDARVVKWKPFAVLAGLDPVYKLDRLSGRYRSIESEQEQRKSAHDLSGDNALDLWQLAQRHPRWLPFVDTEYGSGAYLPMRDGAVFDVTLSPLGGLVARPVAGQTVSDRDG